MRLIPANLADSFAATAEIHRSGVASAEDAGFFPPWSCPEFAPETAVLNLGCQRPIAGLFHWVPSDVDRVQAETDHFAE